jgi:methionyl-tRNA formyltransferase
MENTYTYAGKNLLYKPNNYAYSKFYGEKFITDWKESRLDVLNLLPSPIKYTEYYEHKQYLDENGNYITKILLENLIAQLIHDNEVRMDFLSKLVQRFEVSKRVHDLYTSFWKPVDHTAFNSLELYLLYAEMMVLAYYKYKRLDFLNVLLKANDTLISICESFTTQAKVRLAYVIKEEILIIDDLISNQNK